MTAALAALLLAGAASAAPQLEPVDAVARENPCKADADCFITPNGCGVKAVNAANRPAPLTAAERRKRPLPACRGVVRSETPKALCVEQLCRVAWMPKKKSTRAPVK